MASFALSHTNPPFPRSFPHCWQRSASFTLTQSLCCLPIEAKPPERARFGIHGVVPPTWSICHGGA